jgi:hypothetical protein
MSTATPPSPSPAGAASRAQARAARRMEAAVADFFLPDDARLDDRTRVMATRVLRSAIGALATAIRQHAVRLLEREGAGDAAARLPLAGEEVSDRLARPGLLPPELVEELIARVRHDGIADALPVTVDGPDEPSFLVRLAAVPDPVVATAAAALLAAETRRRDEGGAAGSELPAELHHRLAWLVAAALHEASGSDAAIGRALAEATGRSIAAYDEGDRLDAVATRLAIAIDARADELPDLLLDALADRRLALFVAVLARALGLVFDQARALVIEPNDERLWLGLRAIALDRPTVARVALALADADPRRDIEDFAERLDEVVAVPPEAAREALAALTLPSDFRAALRALDAA